MDREILENSEKFFCELHLYDKVKWSGADVFKVAELLHFSGTIDSYCIECKKAATFVGSNGEIPSNLVRQKFYDLKRLGASLTPSSIPSRSTTFNPPSIGDAFFHVDFLCARDSSHRMTFFFFNRVEQEKEGENGSATESIQKIGQYPSYASIRLPDLKRFRSVLDSETIEELTKGILLGSHDTSIGAFVYLRRVFEKLIQSAAKLAISEGYLTEAGLSQLRMDEKIRAIKDYLPNFVVENPKLYGLLSKGVHEWSETECNKMFEVIKISIEMILEQKLENKNKLKKLAEAQAELTKAIGNISDGV